MLKKKSLGQHFLHAKQYLQLIAKTGDIQPEDTILEIGPGDGALTQELLHYAKHIIAVEKDVRLIPILKEKFSKEIREGKLFLYEADILSTPISHFKLPHTYKIIANIPYYITAALLKKFLSADHQPSEIVFLVQKEVAQRIAKSVKESLLSLSVKVYGTPALIRKVPKGVFIPPPRVDSAILSIKNISRKNFVDARHEKRFFLILHAGFSSKRKFLKNNLSSSFGLAIDRALEKAAIPIKARAEDVKLEQWLTLAGFTD